MSTMALTCNQPGMKVHHREYLSRLMEVVTEMNGKHGFTNRTCSGMRITVKTFSDATKITSEAVHRVIIMLLVRFGFLHIGETRDGLLLGDHRPLNNLKGNHYDTTNRTADRLHAKIMNFFGGSSSCMLSKHYEPTVLLCPELSLEKTRRALSYFVQFCIFSRDCRKEINAKNQEAIQIKLRRDALKSTNELLRLKVQDEKARAVELEAKLQENAREYETKVKEAETASKPIEELKMNIKIKEAKNELEALLKLKTQNNKTPIAIATASNGCLTSSDGLSLPSERCMRKRKRYGCSDYGCKQMAAELAHMKGKLVETEQFLERTIKLKKRFGKAESQLKTEKARQEMEELKYNKAREFIVRVITLEKELETKEKQHNKIIEGMRSKLAMNEEILLRDAEHSRELGKKSVVKWPNSKWKQLTNPEKNNFQRGSN